MATTKKNNLDAKSRFNLLANNDMRMWNILEETKYSSSKQAHDGEWNFKILMVDPAYARVSAEAKGASRKEAEKLAYERLMVKIDALLQLKDDEGVIKAMRALLIRSGDVETNPGPTLTFRQVRISRNNGEFTFVLPNNFVFTLPESDVTVMSDRVIIDDHLLKNRVGDEIAGLINAKNFMSKEGFIGKTEPRAFKESLNRTTIYSNHDDFQATKRLCIFPSYKAQRAINGNDFRFALEGESTGQILFKDSFVFVPRNYLAVRWSKKNYIGSNTPVETYFQALASIARQTMDVVDVAEMAAQLSSLQMTYVNCPHEADSYLGQFSFFFRANVEKICAGRKTDFSFGDVWDKMLGMKNVFIPMEEFHPPGKKETLLSEMTSITPFTGPIQEDITEMWSKKTMSFDLDGTPIEELCKLFKSGALNNYGENTKVFSFDTKMSFTYISEDLGFELDDMETVVKFLVEYRLSEENLAKAFNATVDFAHMRTNEKTTRALIKKMVNLRIDSYFQPGLARMNLKKITKKPKLDIPTHRSEIITFLNDTIEKRICQRAQSEFFKWSRILGQQSKKQVFNNIHYMLGFYIERNLVVQPTKNKTRKKAPQPEPESESEAEEEPLQDEPEVEEPNGEFEDREGEAEQGEKETEPQSEDRDQNNTRFRDKFVDFISAPFRAAKNVYRKLESGVESIVEINRTAKEANEFFQGQFKHLPSVVSTMKEFDFTSLQGAFHSTKTFINAWFTEFVTKICQCFGVEYEGNIEATTLFFYYMLWIKNECNVVRYMIILDIAVSLGIADALLRIIKNLLVGFKNLFKKMNGETGQQKTGVDEFLEELSVKEQSLKVINEKTTQKEFQKLQEKDELDEPESWLDYLLSIIGNSTAPVLGIMTTAVVAALGLTPFKDSHTSLGEKVIKSARNISFLALGAAALPKLFESIMKVISFIQDQAMGLFKDGHKTTIQLHTEVENWLKTAMYVEGMAPFLFVSSLDFNIKFLKDWVEMVRLQKEAPRIKALGLGIEFRDRVKIMNKLYPICDSAIKLLIGQNEIFHVQLWSETCGVGKTDLAQTVMKALALEIEKEEMATKTQLNLKSEPIKPAMYPMNEALKHNDLYYGQQIGYMDETNVFSTTDPEMTIMYMQMLSGCTTISQQAALNDKGRVFDFRCLVSNTNNAYTTIAGMTRPTALFRRRNLFRISLKEDTYDERDGGLQVINDAKITKLGLNRTKGEHLLISHYCAEEEKPGDKRLQNMEVKDFIRVVIGMFKKHIQTETRRLQEKNGMYSVMKEIISSIQKEVISISHDYNKSDLMSVVEELKKIRNKTKDEMSEENKNSAVWKAHEEMIDSAINVAQYLDDDKVNAARSFEEKQMSQEWIHFDLETHKQETKLVRVLQPKLMDKGEHQPELFRWRDGPVYTGPTENLSPQARRHLRYWLAHYSRAFNVTDFTRMKNYEIALIRRRPLIEKWKVSFFNMHNDTMRAISSFSKWLMDNVVDRIGRSFISGLAVAVGIVGMFFGLAAVGKILSPTPASYNHQRNKALQMPMAYLHESREDMMLAQKATYEFTFVGNNAQTGMAIGIRGSIFLVNQHTIPEFDRVMDLYVYDDQQKLLDKSTGVKKYQVSKADLSYIPDSDCVLVNVTGFRPVRAVMKHFISEADCVDNMINFRTGMYQAISLRTKQPISIETIHKVEREWFATGFGHGYPQECKLQQRSILFNAPNNIRSGDSGGIVMHDNTRVSGKFCGILLAGIVGTNVTFAGIVTREMLEKACRKFPDHAKFDKTPKGELIPVCNSQLLSVFDYKQEVYDSPIQNQAVSRSLGFVKSPIHGAFEVESVPAIQDHRDTRQPEGARHHLQVSLNKTNGEEEIFITKDERDFMKRFAKANFKKYVPGLAQLRVFNYKQSIMGIRAQGSSSINTKTSPGLPYKLEKGVKGKAPFIKYDEVYKNWDIQQRVFDDCDMYMDKYESHQIPFNFKGEFRKKELVSQEKIDNPKTRTVATGNLIHQIIYGMYTKDLYTMTKNVWNNGGSSPFALGVDAERHWDQVAEHLEFHDCVYDFDIKAWEKKICLNLLLLNTEVIYELMDEAYKSRGEKFPLSKAIIDGIAIDFTDTEVIFEDVMYRKRSGLLSGHPGTFMENSNIHLMLVGLIVFRLLRDKHPAWANIPFIMAHVKIILAADDIQIALSPMIRRIISAQDLIAGYAELTFEVTAADKSKNIKQKKLTESQFLKHTYRQNEEGVFYAVPNTSIIYQLFNWIRDDTKMTLDEQFTINLQNAFRFAFWRGEEEYEQIRQTANIALMKHGREWTFSYDEMRAIVGYQMAEAERLAHSHQPRQEEEEECLGD